MLLMGYQRLKKDQQAVCALTIASDSVVEMHHKNAGSMPVKLTIANLANAIVGIQHYPTSTIPTSFYAITSYIQYADSLLVFLQPLIPH